MKNYSDIQIQIEDVSSNDLISYLRHTSIADKVNLHEYTEKVIHRAMFFVARENGNIVGMNIVYMNDLQNHNAYITYIHVKEDYRNRGIGRNLLMAAIKQAQRNKFTTISLEVRKENINAKNLYSRLNFRIHQETDKSFFMQKVIK